MNFRLGVNLPKHGVSAGEAATKGGKSFGQFRKWSDIARHPKGGLLTGVAHVKGDNFSRQIIKRSAPLTLVNFNPKPARSFTKGKIQIKS